MFCSPTTTITTYTVVIIDGIEYGTTTSKTRAAGVFHLPPGEERTSDEPFTCATGSKRTVYGICRGPYTVELGGRDDRVEQAGGRRIKVTTDTEDNLDDTGTVEVVYYHARNPNKIQRPLLRHRCGHKRRLHAAGDRQRERPPRPRVVRVAPPQEWIDGTTTSEWTCTQYLIDHYENELHATAPCTSDQQVPTTTDNDYPTPPGCTVVVTVAKNGKGFDSTVCLTSAQTEGFETEIAAKHPDETAIDVSTLPPCPDSTHTDAMYALPTDASGRKRCVARN